MRGMQHKELPLKNAAPVIKESFFITFPVDTALLSPRDFFGPIKS